MSLITGLLFLVCATLIGRALLPSRTILSRSLWEELGVAYLLGTGVVTVVITAGFVAGLSMSLLWWLPLIGGIAAFALDGQRKAVIGNYAEVPWTRPIGLLLAVLAVAAFLATIALPLNEFDAIYHWAYRGKVLLHEGTPLNEAITGMVNADGYGRLVTHPNYPFGIPILEAWTAHWGGWNARWVQLPLSLWSACLPMAVAFGLRGYSNQAASYGALLTAATPILYSYNFLEDGFDSISMAGLTSTLTLGGGADLAVMAMLGAACALFIRARQVDCKRAAICAGLALAGTVMMKNEGLALAGVCLLALLLVSFIPPRRTRVAIPFAAVAVVSIAPWLGLRAQLPAIDENYSEQMTVENVMHYLGGGRELVEKAPIAMSGREQVDLENAPARIGLVLTSFWEEFSDLRSWGLLWLLMIVALPVTRQRLADPETRWLALVVLGGVCLYLLILLVTPWNFPSLRDKGIPERLLVHLVGPIVLMFGAALPKKDT
ncbi:MAG: hypothetical protein GY747_02965 [Planctomycetes bacterium]|nr:hypothetical protein [Planctomycetota bacterium]MCP4770137.1 hypothetical protein [Planctomycetota bacterium]MCP4860715.1 hypothetical protein [Planctomycetota bacterium]